MKKSITFLLAILMISAAFLNAENDERGAWFKESMENGKELEKQFPPENKSILQYNWKHNKDELINTYKEFIEKHGGEKLTKGDYPDKILETLIYYYDETDPDIGKTIDFFIYVVENDINESMKSDAINNITTIALEGNNKAKTYISSNVNNNYFSNNLNLHFHLANITIRENQQSLDFIMDLIKKTQNVETTNLKYSSPDESKILWYLLRNCFGQRYLKNLDYEYVLPLMKQMLFSRSKSVQDLVAMEYLSMTNKSEMREIYDDCWTKIQNNSTPRKLYINALFGLQALYSLSQRDIGKYKIVFEGISSYFAKLGGLTLINDKWEYTEAEGEPRLTKEEKRYFQKRLRSK